MLIDRYVDAVLIGIIAVLIVIIIYLLIERKNILDQRRILKTIINSSPDMICYKDSEGRWIEANNTIKEIINCDECIIGKRDLDLMKLMPEREAEFRRCHETDKEIWKYRKIKIVEETFKRKNGTYQTFDVIKVPLYNNDGSEKGLAVIGRDITDKKKSEKLKKQSEDDKKVLKELKRYNEIRTDFFANLSHELRTPLTLILSAIRLVEMANDDYTEVSKEKINKYINIMRQNSFRLIRLINNLIDITKSQDGYLELHLCEKNIVSIIEEITVSINHFAEERQINLIFDTDIEEKYTACDEDKIERIILNLMSNAIKFTPNGGELRVEIEEKNNGIEISVTDTGIGIPIESQECVFERFTQVDKSLSRKNEGSGIGLSLVKTFVEMHKGTIKIDSEYKKGTKFIVNLPCNLICENKEVKSIKSENSKVQIINIEFSDIYS